MVNRVIKVHLDQLGPLEQKAKPAQLEILDLQEPLETLVSE